MKIVATVIRLQKMYQNQFVPDFRPKAYWGASNFQ